MSHEVIGMCGLDSRCDGTTCFVPNYIPNQPYTNPTTPTPRGVHGRICQDRTSSLRNGTKAHVGAEMTGEYGPKY